MSVSIAWTSFELGGFCGSLSRAVLFLHPVCTIKTLRKRRPQAMDEQNQILNKLFDDVVGFPHVLKTQCFLWTFSQSVCLFVSSFKWKSEIFSSSSPGSAERTTIARDKKNNFQTFVKLLISDRLILLIYLYFVLTVYFTRDSKLILFALSSVIIIHKLI